MHPVTGWWIRIATPALLALVICAAVACYGAAQQGETGAATSPGNTTYYIDSQRGDDANPGTTAANPWRALDRVNATTFAPGDRILFRAGTRCTGQLRPQGLGKDGAPIVIRSFGEGPRPRIDGEGKVSETVLLHNVEYWEVSDLEITNTGETSEGSRSGVAVSLHDFGTAHHIHLKDLFVHDVNGSNVKGHGRSGIIFGNGGPQLKSRFDGLLIENCHLVRTDRNGITGWNEYWPRTDWYPNLNVVIRGNLLEDIGGDGIVPIGCDGALIEHNILRGGRRRADDYAAGIWPWSCDNTVIQFNEVSGMRGDLDGQGFDSDWNSRNTLIQYNYSHDNDGGFLLICNDGSSKPPVNAGNVGTVVRYNISQNDGARTFQISAVENTHIYNNTIYVKEGMDVYGVHCHSWSGWAKDTHFSNNIFYAKGTVRYDFGESTGNVFANNVFYGNHVGRPEDPKAITADPKLVDPGSGDNGFGSLDGYKLRADSPCIGAGLPIPTNGGRDFWGNRVPKATARDIGSHQTTRRP
jgi:hypothetical protein